MIIHRFRDPNFTAVPLNKRFTLLLAWSDGGPLVVLVNFRAWALRVGWGYDEDLPLSAIPRSHRKRTVGGRPDFCFAWCGFYIGFTRAGSA